MPPKAVLERLAMQVRLNLDVERMLPTFLHKKYIIKGDEVHPNKPQSMFLNIWNDNNNLRRIANSIVAKETDVSRHARAAIRFGDSLFVICTRYTRFQHS